MRNSLYIAAVVICCASFCRAQEIENDIKGNTFISNDSISVFPGKTDRTHFSSLPKNVLGSFQKSGGIVLTDDSETASETMFSLGNLNDSGTAFIPLWRNTGLMATGNISTHPGLMEIHSGSVGVFHNIGKVSLYVGGEANKYGYFNGLHTQYGINGRIVYNLSSNLTITGYANYYFGQPPMMPNGMMMPPSMIGYYGASSFGGTINYQFNETFGLIVGGEAVQQFGTTHYRFEPIVTPTVKIGRVRIGLPVGQIVNDVIRSHLERRKRH